MVEQSDIVEALAEVFRQRPLAPKWVLSPSLRVGKQWLDGVCRGGTPVINARAVTLARLCFDLALPELRSRRLRLLDSTGAELLLRRVVLDAADDSYLRWRTPTVAVLRAVLGTVTDLRLAGVPLDQKQGIFEVAAKGRELRRIVEGYDAVLRSERLVDHAGVLQLATDRLSADPAALPADTLLLWPGEPPRGGELRFWHAVPAGQRLLLAAPAARAVDDAKRLRDADLLRFVDNPTAAPAARGDGSLQVQSAVGEINEVRQVLRRCLQQELALDQVELLYCDAETYPPLILSVMLDIFGDDPPVTFADGLPVRLFRPGRALAAWLRWQTEGFVAATLADMVQDRLLVVDDSDGGERQDNADRFDDLAATLRALPIGAGRPRYLPQVDEAIVRTGPGPEARRLAVLRALITDLFEDAPEPETEQPLSIVDAAIRFVTERAPRASRNDAYSRRALLRALDELKGSLEQELAQTASAAGQDIRERLGALPGRLRVGGMGPRPGCLHAASIWAGGHANRANLFVVGLDDLRFPGAERQDPLLLDRERQRLSEQLPTATGQRGRRLRRARDLLARVGARSVRVVLCSSRVQLADDRELHPSSELVAVRRLLAHDRSGALPAAPSASFGPSSEQRCCTSWEWWLWKLARGAGGPTTDQRDLLVDQFPHLGRGLEAGRARRSEAFTEYDGCVPQAGADLDPWKEGAASLSPTPLETLGRCPMDFFCRHVLQLEEPVSYRRRRSGQWPDPGKQGAILHEVFYRYMTTLQRRRQQPSRSRDAKLLAHLVDEQLSRLCRSNPPPDLLARQRLADQLHRTAGIFLHEEEQQCLRSVPFCFEAVIGMPTSAAGAETPLDTANAVAVSLGDRGMVRFAGKIDRVDLLPGRGAGLRFAVWDYKTGSSHHFDEGDPFRSGRSVQPFVYRMLVEQQLRRCVSPQARVVRFGFFFPGVREHGRRISWSPGELAGGAAVVADLCAMVAAGCFPCAVDVDDLERSAYAAVFGQPQDAARSVIGKLAGRDPALDVYRRLRGRDA